MVTETMLIPPFSEASVPEKVGTRPEQACVQSVLPRGMEQERRYVLMY